MSGFLLPDRLDLKAERGHPAGRLMYPWSLQSRWAP